MSHVGNRLVPGAVPKALKGRFKIAQGNALGNARAPINLLFLHVLGSMGDPMELDRPWSPKVFSGRGGPFDSFPGFNLGDYRIGHSDPQDIFCATQS